MSSESTSTSDRAAIIQNASWRKWPTYALVGGGVLTFLGLILNSKQFMYSYLLAYMFCLSICLGSLILIILHHLFDAGWSVPTRRILENITAGLFPWMAVLFVPIAFFATNVYEWMSMDPPDHALHNKEGYLNLTFFFIRAIIYFAVWCWLSRAFRNASLAQDKDGAASHTHKMRKLAGAGVFLYAFTSTGAAIDWMKAIQHQWFSTMYGVWYFAASVWTTLAVLYMLVTLFKDNGVLKGLVGKTQSHNIGILMFAFTVFYAYVTFSQYFIIWNAAIPEETFWYVLREQGSWWQIGMLMIFGHFVLPFLLLLRIDAKLNSFMMICIGCWFLLMHYLDLSFNIMPNLHPEGFVLHWIDIGCLVGMVGFLVSQFLKNFVSHPVYPLKDPRLHEALPHDVHVGEMAAADGGAK